MPQTTQGVWLHMQHLSHTLKNPLLKYPCPLRPFQLHVHCSVISGPWQLIVATKLWQMLTMHGYTALLKDFSPAAFAAPKFEHSLTLKSEVTADNLLHWYSNWSLLQPLRPPVVDRGRGTVWNIRGDQDGSEVLTIRRVSRCSQLSSSQSVGLLPGHVTD